MQSDILVKWTESKFRFGTHGLNEELVMTILIGSLLTIAHCCSYYYYANMNSIVILIIIIKIQPEVLIQ